MTKFCVWTNDDNHTVICTLKNLNKVQNIPDLLDDPESYDIIKDDALVLAPSISVEGIY